MLSPAELAWEPAVARAWGTEDEDLADDCDALEELACTVKIPSVECH
jgi:hypothetical protein